MSITHEHDQLALISCHRQREFGQIYNISSWALHFCNIYIPHEKAGEKQGTAKSSLEVTPSAC
jgi:hypothetical protein